MKSTLYIAIFIAALVMMVSAAPSPKKTCQLVKDNHANSVCKKYCGKSGYLLGECGTEGICICKSKKAPVKKTTKKVIKKTTKKAPKKAVKKSSKKSAKKSASNKSTASKKQL